MIPWFISPKSNLFSIFNWNKIIIYFFEKIVYPFNRSARTPSIFWDSLQPRELCRQWRGFCNHRRLLPPPNSRRGLLLSFLVSAHRASASSPRTAPSRAESAQFPASVSRTNRVTRRIRDLTELSIPIHWMGLLLVRVNRNLIVDLSNGSWGRQFLTNERYSLFSKRLILIFGFMGFWSDSLDRNLDWSF